MHRIYPSHFCSENFVELQSVSLDEYFKNNPYENKIDFIKLDAEGSELGILQGMKNILNLNKKLKIFLEFVPSCIKEYGSNPERILNLLQSNEFQISYINEDKKKVEQVDDMDYLLQKYDGDKLEEHPKRTNLLCVRN